MEFLQVLQSIPWGPVLFLIGLIWSLIKLHFDVESMKKEIKQLGEDRKAMQKQHAEEKELMFKQFEQMNKEMAETNKELAIIRSHFEMGTLTKLKTYGSRR